MSDDSRGSRGADAKPTSSVEWGAPPAWSPWSFQFPNLNRDKHIYREAHANAHAEGATKIGGGTSQGS
jgi:hypothetical protein